MIMVNVPWCHDCNMPDGLCKCVAETVARPTVKPLKWGKTSYGKPEVETIFGFYRVHDHVSGGWGATFRKTNILDRYGRQNFATEAEAIAACEAHYEQRVRSALA